MDIHIMDEPEVPDAAPPIAVLPVMDQILTWIGFDNEATRLRLQTESFESFADILEMSEKDIRRKTSVIWQIRILDAPSLTDVLFSDRAGLDTSLD